MYHLEIEEISLNDVNDVTCGMKGISIYTQSKYLKAMSSIRPVKCYMIKSNNNAAGVFPLIDRRKFLVRYAPQPPFTQYFGLMMNNSSSSVQREMDAKNRIVDSYTKFLNSRYRMFLLPQHHEYSDIRPFIWKNVKYSILYTYHFHISRDNLGSIDRRIRNKDEEDFTLSNDIELMYRDIQGAYKGKPPIGEADFHKLMNQLIEYDMISIYRNKEAAVCFLRDEERKIVYEYIAAGHNTGKLIRDIFAQGLYAGYTFDFQGANTENIARYKALFNPLLKQYFCIRKHI